MTTLWIKNPLAILVSDEANADSGIVVKDKVIQELVPKGCLPSTAFDETFDASQHVVLPGLINAHHHFYQTLTRATPSALNKELFSWLQSLYPIWAKLTPAHIEISTRLALAELLLSGCTTASDHHYVFPQGLEDAIDIQIAEFQKMGVRAVVTRGSMSLSVEDGGLPPKSVVQDEDEILADSERLIQKYHQAHHGAEVQVVLAPCSPFSVDENLMVHTADLARQYRVRLHTHLCETHDETKFCMNTMGMRPVDYLEKVGWLNSDVWLAHGIHFLNEEIQRLGASGVGICHCPSSNMVLASGICATLDLEKAGAPVGLGVDGSASNDGSNMMQEVRQAFLLQRLKYGSIQVGHQDVLRWATQGSARCLGRTDIGIIAPGKQADLALFTPKDLGFSGSGDPLAALVLCGAHQADRVMVGGSWVVENGHIPNLDLEALIHAHSKLSQGLNHY